MIHDDTEIPKLVGQPRKAETHFAKRGTRNKTLGTLQTDYKASHRLHN